MGEAGRASARGGRLRGSERTRMMRGGRAEQPRHLECRPIVHTMALASDCSPQRCPPEPECPTLQRPCNKLPCIHYLSRNHSYALSV